MSEQLPPSERPPAPPRSSWEEEKEREKEAEKEAEKAEKPYAFYEKYRRDPLSGVIWALVLIWAGVVFIGDNLGLLPQVGRADPWNWIFFGAGVLVMLEVLLRLVSPDYARPVGGRVVWGGILMAIGLSGIYGFDVTWPLILVLIGVSILVGSVMRR